MASSSMIPLLGPEFNDFLYAPVNDDNNGALMSIVSLRRVADRRQPIRAASDLRT